jgi:hypothetical protein
MPGRGFAPEGKRRIRRKVTGRTKTEVKNKLKDKLKAFRCVLDAGIQSSPSDTMTGSIEDWLTPGLTRLSPSTVANYRYLAQHAVCKLGQSCCGT